MAGGERLGKAIKNTSFFVIASQTHRTVVKRTEQDLAETERFELSEPR